LRSDEVGADWVWYVAYGSNLSMERLRCYLSGGRPVGALRSYPGARDASDPVDVSPVWLDGGLRFAGVSSVWGGAVACFDPLALDRVAARAYLMSAGQICDLVAQEIRRPLAVVDHGLRETITEGSSRFPTGLYDALIRVGSLCGFAMVTLAATGFPAPGAPSAAYVRVVAAGLAETHGWGPAQVAAYLLRWPRISDVWTAAQLVEAQMPWPG